jgi:hypothetical protein
MSQADELLTRWLDIDDRACRATKEECDAIASDTRAYLNEKPHEPPAEESEFGPVVLGEPDKIPRRAAPKDTAALIERLLGDAKFCERHSGSMTGFPLIAKDLREAADALARLSAPVPAGNPAWEWIKTARKDAAPVPAREWQWTDAEKWNEPERHAPSCLAEKDKGG